MRSIYGELRGPRGEVSKRWGGSRNAQCSCAMEDFNFNTNWIAVPMVRNDEATLERLLQNIFFVPQCRMVKNIYFSTYNFLIIA